MNVVYLSGHIGKDPELRYTGKGRAVMNFSLATNEVYFDGNGEKHEKTEWHNCVVWGRMAEDLKPYLCKGARVMVTGRLQTRKWPDKENKMHYMTEVMAEHIGAPFHAQAARATSSQDAPAAPAQDAGTFPDDGDSGDLPF